MPLTFRYSILYTLLFGVTAVTSHSPRWLRLPPVSVHQWRQADGASLAWHYAQHPAFSEAQISNLFYTGDAHALGEFPLLYWLAGLISHHWGYPAYPLRWIGLVLLFAGGWSFGWIILQLSKRPAIAALGAGLLLTSPVLSYYGPNFLPDAHAFCFILMMLAALFQACRSQSPIWLMAAAACAALAILLKLSMAILPVALALAWLAWMWRRIFRFGREAPPPSSRLKYGTGSPPEGRGAWSRFTFSIPNWDRLVKCGQAPLPFGGEPVPYFSREDGGGVDTHGDLCKAEFPCYWPLIALITAIGAVLAGRWWIAEYNAHHQAVYFLSATRPIWHYDWPFIREVLAGLAAFGLPAFLSAGLYLVCLGSLVLTIKCWRQTPVFLRQTLVLTVMGSLAYALLWFRMLREHDYYLICLLAGPVLLLANGIRLAATLFTGKQMIVALGICWLLGAGHNHFLLSKRLHLAFNPQSSQNLPPDAFLTPEHLVEYGISHEARLLCPRDPSPNIALFALKRQGWTAYNFGDRITADTLYKYQTHFGLTHLALRDSAVYNPLYRQFFPKPAGAIQGWYFYGR
ncbi:MAG: glycosyltransferase family 39 protein [Thermoanaerobaculia bacterium]|nr:glycosyltransferase family 39 protein [Thermoanaerobaculia bacterium]